MVGGSIGLYESWFGACLLELGIGASCEENPDQGLGGLHIRPGLLLHHTRAGITKKRSGSHVVGA